MTKDMAVQPWTAISIEHNSGHLAGRLYWPPKPRAGVVIAHGLDSSMQSSKLNQLGQGLKEAGMAALLFDHTGCGDSPGSHKETTLTTRRDDFFVRSRSFGAKTAPRPHYVCRFLHGRG